MALDQSIAQAIVIVDGNGPTVAARSADFPFAWEEAALTATVRFGPRPAGMACPEAIFAVPVGRTHVAVVTAADLRPGEADTPLGFRFLVLGRALYEVLGDPFAIAARFPPRWGERGTLDSLSWNDGALSTRNVESIAAVLKEGDSPLLLGAAQALIDGGRVIVIAPEADPKLLRGLWQLLPTRSRIDLWPATFAFSADLGFHVVVLPTAPDPWPIGYLMADQARDYPEGRYELALQTAAESGNQADLDHLFARRSTNDTLRLAAYLLAFAVFAAVIGKFL